jgi:RNB domain-containing protein/RNase II-type exonuclease
MNQKVEHRRIDVAAIARKVATDEGFAVDAPAGAQAAAGPVDGGEGAVDERGLLWSSVDNRESTDLDQIEVAERLAGDVIRVKLGIADVDAFVPRGSPLDRHAAQNTTSLYAGVATFPMLPDWLSSGETSLLEGRERLAVVTEIDVSKEGAVVAARIYQARVVNRAKLVYEDVGAWLEGAGPPPPQAAREAELAAQIALQDEAAQRLRRRRIENGALELETVEARAVARDGEVVEIRLTRKSRARELVEDLMIAANGATARWLEARGFASIRRVVREPRRWPRIVELAASYGVALPAEPSPVALSEFLRARRRSEPERFAELSLSVVKLLGPGEYTVADPDSPEGHFGLAVDDYAHSTAPNRRYGDLVTQRLLKAAARGEPPPYSAAELGEIAARCTERENHARAFERTMRKVAAALFLSRYLGASFDAIVTGVTGKGTFVRLLDPPAEGRVVEGEQGLDVGDRTRVRLVATEPERGFLDFVRALPGRPMPLRRARLVPVALATFAVVAGLACAVGRRELVTPRGAAPPGPGSAASATPGASGATVALAIPHTDARIDGDTLTDEAAWQGGAELTAGFEEEGDGRLRTSVNLLWGGGRLYAWFTSPRASHPVGDDIVELRVAPAAGGEEVALSITAGGEPRLRREGGPAGRELAANEIRFGVERGDVDWAAEVAVPLRVLGLRGVAGERARLTLRRCVRGPEGVPTARSCVQAVGAAGLSADEAKVP